MSQKEGSGERFGLTGTHYSDDNPVLTGRLGSQQRDWYSTHLFLEAYRAQANCGPIPAAGTPSWRSLEFNDPRKLLSLALDGEHHVLRCEVAQSAMADGSRAVSAAADWKQVGREVQQRASFRAERPWMSREHRPPSTARTGT
jgi:Protein of unknown function (DUF2742)